MAGLFGIGGSSAKTDRKFQLKSWGDLQNLFNATSKAGSTELKAGIGDVNKSKDYWSALMSGDPTKMSQVLAPQISTLRAQAGQNIMGLEQFSGRSGGTSSAVQAENVEAGRAIQNLFDMLGPEAAQEFSKLSEFEVGAGESLLSTSGSAASEIGQQAGSARPGDQQMQQQQQQAVIQAIAALAGL